MKPGLVWSERATVYILVSTGTGKYLEIKSGICSLTEEMIRSRKVDSIGRRHLPGRCSTSRYFPLFSIRESLDIKVTVQNPNLVSEREFYSLYREKEKRR